MKSLTMNNGKTKYVAFCLTKDNRPTITKLEIMTDKNNNIAGQINSIYKIEKVIFITY